jgi:hypothetical protein
LASQEWVRCDRTRYAEPGQDRESPGMVSTKEGRGWLRGGKVRTAGLWLDKAGCGETGLGLS